MSRHLSEVRVVPALLLIAAAASLFSACATGGAGVAPEQAERAPAVEGGDPSDEGGWSRSDGSSGPEGDPAPEPESSRFKFLNGKKLVEYESADGDTSLWFGVRMQLRYENLEDRPLDPGDQPSHQESGLNVSRARLKLGGHVFAPWLEIYSEYNVVGPFFLDYRATVKAEDWLHLRVGQWKADYDRERIDSSGAQQFVDRSIVTYWFTIDRQAGASLSGRFGEGEDWDSSYWVECLTGQGRGKGITSGEWLWLARYQWNLFGEVLPFSQSDLERREDPAGSISLAGVASRTQYTRFSSGGGGQLPGFEKGRYFLTQLQQGSAYHHRGFSWQQELHLKTIEDEDRRETTRLWGGYAQAGYLLSESVSWWPDPLELALRVAYVDPDTSSRDDYQSEITFGANWFFDGHLNKLTLGLGRLILGTPDDRIVENLIQLQWDLSF